jgi:hypothetical protein
MAEEGEEEGGAAGGAGGSPIASILYKKVGDTFSEREVPAGGSIKVRILAGRA